MINATANRLLAEDKSVKIGVDVGGTNTDAVLMHGEEVLAWSKRPTSPDVFAGTIAALSDILADRDVSQVESVVVGTTHFVNAFVECRGLAPIGVLRIGSPAANSLPPLCDWPAELLASTDVQVRLIGGGHRVYGDENRPLDEQAIITAADEFRINGVKAIAITSIFSTINSAHEERAREILSERLPGVKLTLSSAIGRIGLLERENAAIINALIAPMADGIIDAFQAALRHLDIVAPLYISQNDGTVTSAKRAGEYPVLTFASGPTNSIRGAALLSGGQDGIVIDIGGTTADIGVLVNGFPRGASDTVKIGGVQTNFRMPDLMSIGIGGGSIVRVSDDGVEVGPDSLGYRLLAEGKAFGGEILSATDLAILAGDLDIGDRTALEDVDRFIVRDGMAAIATALDEAVDQMKPSPARLPVTLVGGGAILLQSDLNSGNLTRPANYAVANAVGAALAPLGDETDLVLNYAAGRDQVLSGLIADARERLIAAGADPEMIEPVEVDEVSVPDMPGDWWRVRIRMVGATAKRPRAPLVANNEGCNHE